MFKFLFNACFLVLLSVGEQKSRAVKPTDDTGDIRMRSVAAQQGWLSYCIYKARPEIY